MIFRPLNGVSQADAFIRANSFPNGFESWRKANRVRLCSIVHPTTLQFIPAQILLLSRPFRRQSFPQILDVCASQFRLVGQQFRHGLVNLRVRLEKRSQSSSETPSI
jgi:hypothetical protein